MKVWPTPAAVCDCFLLSHHPSRLTFCQELSGATALLLELVARSSGPNLCRLVWQRFEMRLGNDPSCVRSLLRSGEVVRSAVGPSHMRAGLHRLQQGAEVEVLGRGICEENLRSKLRLARALGQVILCSLLGSYPCKRLKSIPAGLGGVRDAGSALRRRVHGNVHRPLFRPEPLEHEGEMMSIGLVCAWTVSLRQTAPRPQSQQLHLLAPGLSKRLVALLLKADSQGSDRSCGSAGLTRGWGMECTLGATCLLTPKRLNATIRSPLISSSNASDLE